MVCEYCNTQSGRRTEEEEPAEEEEQAAPTDDRSRRRKDAGNCFSKAEFEEMQRFMVRYEQKLTGKRPEAEETPAMEVETPEDGPADAAVAAQPPQETTDEVHNVEVI